MTSIFDSETFTDSDDDSDYEPAVEQFSKEEQTVTLNHEDKNESKCRTRNSQSLLESDSHFDYKLKEVEKSEMNLVEAKDRADSIYKSFLEEAATELKLSENEYFLSKTISSEANTGFPVDTGCKKESCSLNLNVNIPKETSETPNNMSSLDYSSKDFKSYPSTNSISNLEKNSPSLTLSIMKRRDLRSVMGNVLKKRKKETVLSMSMQDWQKFKEEEAIADELKTYNQGKKGYLERKRFLERSDLRRFQIEREMRLSNKQTQGKKNF